MWMDKKIKIAVLGSCASRDIFNSKFIADYKDFYECVSTAWQASVISFMSERLWFEENQKGFKKEISKHQRNTTNRDISKKYRDEFIETQPDYILFDIYTDVKYGIVKTKDRYLTNNPNGFRKSVYYQDAHYEKSLDMFEDEEYMALFYSNFSKFIDWVNINLPNCKVLITKFSETFSYMTKENYPVNFKPEMCETIAKVNKKYDEIYDKLSSDYEIPFLDMQTKTYFADYNHIHGLKPYHYTQQYYDDLFNSLNKMVLKDQLLINRPETTEDKKEKPGRKRLKNLFSK